MHLYRSTIGRPLVLVGVLFAVFIMVSSYSEPVTRHGRDSYDSFAPLNRGSNRVPRAQKSENVDLYSLEDVPGVHPRGRRDVSAVREMAILLDDEENRVPKSRPRKSHAFVALVDRRSRRLEDADTANTVEDAAQRSKTPSPCTYGTTSLHVV